MGDFDTDFDYTDMSSLIVTTISTINTTIAANDTMIADLQAVNDYENVEEEITRQIQSYQQANAQLVRERDGLIAMQPKITAVEGLNAGDKTMLHTFWGLVGETDVRFMTRMITHHAAMLVNQDIIDINAESSHNASVKTCIACNICKLYPMDGLTYEYRRITDLV